MADVYYKTKDSYCYYTNEAKEGYTLWTPGTSAAQRLFVEIELYNDKFIFPVDCYNLFNGAKGGDFNTKSIIDKFDTSQVTSMKSMFSNITYLDFQYYNATNFNTSNVTDMSFMFDGTNFYGGNFDLSYFDTSKVTDMSYMFSFTSLKSLVANWDTSNVTNMLQMFESCENLSTLDISTFDTSNVTSMSHMFNDCKELEELDLSSFDTSSVTDTAYMFNYCWGLKTIYVTESFVNTNITRSEYMFGTCSMLKGQNGTQAIYWTENPIDATYARIDLPGQPGYFTKMYKWIEHDVFIKTSEGWIPVEVYM